jgi:probable F420-dependent oxidoreductase
VTIRFVLPMVYGDPREACALARAAEECGWDAITVSDHVAHPETIASAYPYSADGSIRWDENTPWPDPWVLIGAMAGATERIRFLTNVFILPLRHPLLVAKAVATASAVSNGRVALGIGVGWMREEFALLGQDFASRGRRCDEAIEVLRKLWSGEFVEHRGRSYAFPRLRMLPAPVGRVPIYVGGLSDAALRRAACLGDGWVSDIHSTEELREIGARLRRLRGECGREGEPFALVAGCRDAFDAAGFRRLAEAGVSHALMLPWLLYRSPDSLEGRRDAVRRFADEVIAKTR